MFALSNYGLYNFLLRLNRVFNKNRQVAYALIIGCSLFFLTACDEASPSLEEKKNKILRKAETAGSYLFDSKKECRIIGYTNIEACAASTLELPTEKSAIRSATRAIKILDDFNYMCRGNFPTDYCDDLLDRAFAIARKNSFESEKSEIPDVIDEPDHLEKR